MTAICLALPLSKAFSQAEYKVYTGFMYHFATKTQFPASKNSGGFIIGVVGDSPITANLKALAAVKKVGARRIVVKTFASAASV